MKGLRKALPFVGLILIFVGISIITIFFAEGTWRSDAKIWMGAGIAAIGALLTLGGIYGRAFGPNLQYYTSYALTSIFVLGSLVMVYTIVRNHSMDWDVTEQKLHSLHPRTIEYLRELDRDVMISAFVSSSQKKTVDTVLGRYTRSSPRISYEVRNPIKEGNYARQFAESVEMGDVFIWTGERPAADKPASPDFREKKIRALGPEALTESKLTNAIVQVLRSKRIKVYFLTGHDEISRERQFGGMFGQQQAPGQDSYSGVQEMLKDDMAFEVDDLQIRNTGIVPDDCSLLVCAGPKTDLYPLEAQLIARYLAGGGRALFLIDPSRLRLVRLRQFAQLLRQFGVKIEYDIVLENSPFAQITDNRIMLIVDRFGSHATVNNPVQALQMSFVRTVSRADNAPSTVTVSELLYSSRMAWQEDIGKVLAGQQVEVPEPDRMKELPVAVAVSAGEGLGTGNAMRMAVFGDSAVFEDNFFPNSAWLFANVTNWLVAQEDLIDIPPKRLPDTANPPSLATMRVLFILFVLAFPGLIFFGGLGYVLVRRQVR